MVVGAMESKRGLPQPGIHIPEGEESSSSDPTSTPRQFYPAHENQPSWSPNTQPHYYGTQNSYFDYVNPEVLDGEPLFLEDHSIIYARPEMGYSLDQAYWDGPSMWREDGFEEEEELELEQLQQQVEGLGISTWEADVYPDTFQS